MPRCVAQGQSSEAPPRPSAEHKSRRQPLLHLNNATSVATFTRTAQASREQDTAPAAPPPDRLSRPVEDCERCSALAGVRNLALDDPGPDRPDSHCNFGGVGARRVVQVPMEKPASTASRRSSLSINALRSTAKVS